MVFFQESEDIIAVACSCIAGPSIKCLRKCHYIGAILFHLEDLNRKNKKLL